MQGARTHQASRAGVLLDRDGTIIVDHGYVGSVERVEFIDGAAEAIARAQRRRHPGRGLHQPGGRGPRPTTRSRTWTACTPTSAKVLADAGAHVDVWLSCPYHPDGHGRAVRPGQRRPQAGAGHGAWQRRSCSTSTSASSWVVGDSLCDVGLARAVGARLLYVGPDGHATGAESGADLAVAVERILLSLRSEPVGPTVAARCPPSRSSGTTGGRVRARLRTELARALASVDRAQIERRGPVLNAAHDRDGAVFACGNGGSASIANHLQCDHVKGVRTGTDLRARVQA